jgi:hypothetical protein
VPFGSPFVGRRPLIIDAEFLVDGRGISTIMQQIVVLDQKVLFMVSHEVGICI